MDEQILYLQRRWRATHEPSDQEAYSAALARTGSARQRLEQAWAAYAAAHFEFFGRYEEGDWEPGAPPPPQPEDVLDRLLPTVRSSAAPVPRRPDRYRSVFREWPGGLPSSVRFAYALWWCVAPLAYGGYLRALPDGEGWAVFGFPNASSADTSGPSDCAVELYDAAGEPLGAAILGRTIHTPPWSVTWVSLQAAREVLPAHYHRYGEPVAKLDPECPACVWLRDGTRAETPDARWAIPVV